MTLVIGEDGAGRCAWAQAAQMRDHHDNEWGRPVRDDRALFERMSLEAFQSGLSWAVILRKRERFREAFAGFDPASVARFTASDVERLLADPGIVRNRLKIEATISNAKAVLNLDLPLSELLWSFAPSTPHEPVTMAEVPAQCEQSRAMARELKRRGFGFVGPTTAYALMQATGMVNDHLVGCVARMGDNGTTRHPSGRASR